MSRKIKGEKGGRKYGGTLPFIANFAHQLSSQ
jgi:hypothetical protein